MHRRLSRKCILDGRITEDVAREIVVDALRLHERTAHVDDVEEFQEPQHEAEVAEHIALA